MEPGLMQGELTPDPAPSVADPRLGEQLMRVLDAAAVFGESVAAAFDRKECELRELFSGLNPADARALHDRLASPRPDDRAATRFQQLVAARRERLLAFLADAPRRESLRSRCR